MEEKILTEETEILDSGVGAIPEELKKYLEADEDTLGKIEEVLTDIDDRIDSLNKEKEDSEKSFEDRLNEFQEMLAKEKEEAFNEFARREQDLDAEKEKVNKIKIDEQENQAKYVDSLVEISNKFNSKINTIEEAIKACEDNETLNKALEEEKEKLERTLDEEYISRKEDLNKVLEEVGINTKPIEEPEPVAPVEPEPVSEPMPNIDIDFNTPDIVEKQTEDTFNNVNLYDDNEVVEHEPREDVINEIYQSKDVMEGHVFPYLKSIME